MLPRPFTLPIIIEKERRNGGEIGFLDALCIPSAGGSFFIEPSLQTRNRPEGYLYTISPPPPPPNLPPPPPFRSVPVLLGNRFEPPLTL